MLFLFYFMSFHLLILYFILFCSLFCKLESAFAFGISGLVKVALTLIESKTKAWSCFLIWLFWVIFDHVMFYGILQLVLQIGVCIVVVKYEWEWTNGGALHKHWLSLHGCGKFYELLWRPYSCTDELWPCCTYAWSGIF